LAANGTPYRTTGNYRLRQNWEPTKQKKKYQKKNTPKNHTPRIGWLFEQTRSKGRYQKTYRGGKRGPPVAFKDLYTIIAWKEKETRQVGRKKKAGVAPYKKETGTYEAILHTDPRPSALKSRGTEDWWLFALATTILKRNTTQA